MKAKIDWYKEVLELEPGSKVFFPLARLLAENGQLQDALSTLRFGLERHPEFIEARLYLIDLLYKNSQITQCEPQVEQLTRLFSKYPGFWDAWGVCTKDAAKKTDMSLLLRFLAALFQYPDVGLREIVERGLSSLAALPEEMPLSLKYAGEADEKLSRTDAAAANFSTPVADAGMSDAAAPASREIFPEAADREEIDDAEEPFTLRTKSMADILARQGDANGALEIYRELALRAESPEEREDINERIAQLSSSQAQSADALFHSQPVAQPPGKQRMQLLLESLAERLEARALV